MVHYYYGQLQLIASRHKHYGILSLILASALTCPLLTLLMTLYIYIHMKDK